MTDHKFFGGGDKGVPVLLCPCSVQESLIQFGKLDPVFISARSHKVCLKFNPTKLLYDFEIIGNGYRTSIDRTVTNYWNSNRSQSINYLISKKGIKIFIWALERIFQTIIIEEFRDLVQGLRNLQKTYKHKRKHKLRFLKQITDILENILEDHVVRRFDSVGH